MTLREHYEQECINIGIRFGVDPDRIKKTDKTRRTARARALVAMQMRKHCPHSWSAIGAVMGVNHSSVLRMCRGNRAEIEYELRSMMTEEDRIAAAQAALVEQERIRREHEALDEAARKVKVLSPGETVDHVTLLLTDDCRWKRRWGLALHEARKADQPDVVFQQHMKELFPLTWQTPSALYGPQEVRP